MVKSYKGNLKNSIKVLYLNFTRKMYIGYSTGAFLFIMDQLPSHIVTEFKNKLCLIGFRSNFEATNLEKSLLSDSHESET